MVLEQWQKLADIALKGVIATGVGVGGFLLAIDESHLNRSKLCGELLQQNFDFVQKNVFSDARKAMLDARLESQGSMCTFGPKYIQVLNNNWQIPEIGVQDQPEGTKAQPGAMPSPAASPIARPDGAAPNPPVTVPAQIERQENLNRPQWVAVSRNGDTSYSAVNFDLAKGDSSELNTRGNILAARWFVNIRAKNTPVSRGDNPVIGQFLAGQCAVIREAVKGKLNQWARVERVECPATGG